MAATTIAQPVPSRSADAAGHAGAPPDPVVLEAVSKRYGGRRRGVYALHEVSARFRRGSLTAVMGVTGSGKSTLLQCAAGLDAPTSGRIVLAGTDLQGLSRRKLAMLRRRRVGFVFQSLNLVPTLSVAENIALPLRLDGRPVRRDQIRELAERVGIGAQLGRLPHTLSGGQQQRAAIARALITSPEVVFADEPTAALDLVMAQHVLGLLRQAVDELGQTVVVVTHDPVVAGHADRVLLLADGRLADEMVAPDPVRVSRLLRDFGGRR
jgi:putative ABC transport system ATP-binding protein